MNQLRHKYQFWFRVALFNFFAAAIMGCLLRLAFVVELPWIKYRYLLHGHSHVAMLGWVYLGLFTLLIHRFLDEQQRGKRIYKLLYWSTQLSVIGMLISFPLQGYAVFSIFFSTLHVVLSYLFAGQFWKDLRRSKQSSPSSLLAKTAIGWMVFSTIGLWAMGPIMGLGFQKSIWYYLAVQFFLHFQFNGWYLFGVLALFFKFWEKQNGDIIKQGFSWFYRLLFISCPLTFALAVAWSKPSMAVFLVNSLGVSIQLLAILLLLRLYRAAHKASQQELDNLSSLLFKLAFLCLVGKCFLQFAVAIPEVATIAYTIRNYVIGFIHLLLLGGLTFGLLAIAAQQQLILMSSRLFKPGVMTLIAGFVLTEAILFIQGTMFWGTLGFLPMYYELLFAVSLLLPLGVLLILLAQIRHKQL